MAGPVLLTVENTPWKTTMENTFIEAFTNAGIKPILVPGGQEKELKVVFLDQSFTFQSIPSGGYLRLCRSKLEARTQTGKDVGFVGMFSRESVDTVATRTDLVQSSAAESGFFEQILGPLLLIAGSVTIIALLFTVRS